MSDEQSRRFEATAKFHDRMAAAFEATGQKKNAEAARKAASLCRANAKGM
jgi:hypothetical protein